MPPPPESAEAIILRRKVVLSFWAVFLFLGLPLWFQTTTIHRTPLPLSVFQTLDDELQGGYGIRSDDCPGILRVPVGVKESCLFDTTTGEISEQVKLLAGTEENQSVFSLQLSDRRECRTDCAIPKYSLDCIISDRTPLPKVKVSESDEIRVYIPSHVGSKAMIAKGLYDAFVGDILFFNKHHLGSIDRAALPDVESTMYRGAPYADAVHLSFTLLISLDTLSSYGEIEVLSPEFQSEWRGHVEKLLNILQSGELSRYLSSITFDTDVGFQYMTDSKQEWARLEEDVSPEKLSSLLDTWDLQPITLLNTNSKSSASKVLQFVYFLPPHSANTKSSLSFTVANWGGVVMAGDRPDLHSTMRTFEKQIDKLLSPVSFSLADGSWKSRKLLPHRHEFARIATIMNLRGAVETLSALSRLVSSLPEMAVPLTVRDLVDAAVKEWRSAVTYLHADIDGVAENRALRHAAAAARFARLAVFDKNMMLNMFVPFEHKIAVYLPLLGPVLVPLVAGLRRVIIESRKKKVSRKKKEQ
ncbi:phosphatidylinositol-glycan biosynthesis class S protein [Lipomyces orientalis]|uniref:Phosphatidylinositol-glycan biosynthesis class S protein n=1 Tax=Lipomyces orientalis TaxID=1233043 RepID=A0ACC3TU42_9ASCO